MNHFNLLLGILFIQISFSQTIEPSISAQNNKPKKFLIEINYGLGQRIAAAAPSLNDIQKKFITELKSGQTINFKLGYKINKNTFLGMMYSQFNSNYSMSNLVYTEPDGTNGAGTGAANDEIYFIGAGAGYFAKGFLTHDTVNIDMYLGYIDYTTITKFTNTYTTTGGNLGTSLNAAYYFGLSQNIKIGPILSYNGGIVRKFTTSSNSGYSTTTTLPEKSGESLYKVDFMIGAQISF